MVMRGVLAAVLQVREEEIEAAHREQVQKRSAATLAAKAPKFAAIQTARIRTGRQLADAKVGGNYCGCHPQCAHLLLTNTAESPSEAAGT